MMGADDPWSWVNERPERERVAALRRHGTPFDPATTPAEPENGVLAEVFRTAPGTVVNDHPEGRFAPRCTGSGADREPWDDYYRPRLAPAATGRCRWQRAAGWAAISTRSRSSTTRSAWVLDLPAKRRVTRHRRIAAADGPVIRTISCLDDSDGIVEQPDDAEDYFATITRGTAGRPRLGASGRRRHRRTAARGHADRLRNRVDGAASGLIPRRIPTTPSPQVRGSLPAWQGS